MAAPTLNRNNKTSMGFYQPPAVKTVKHEGLDVFDDFEDELGVNNDPPPRDRLAEEDLRQKKQNLFGIKQQQQPYSGMDRPKTEGGKQVGQLKEQQKEEEDSGIGVINLGNSRSRSRPPLQQPQLVEKKPSFMEEKKKSEDEDSEVDYIPVFDRSSTSRMKPPLSRPKASLSLPNKPEMKP